MNRATLREIRLGNISVIASAGTHSVAHCCCGQSEALRP